MPITSGVAFPTIPRQMRGIGKRIQRDRLRDESECGDMGRFDDREVPAIECGDRASPEPLACRDDRSVDRAKRKVSVGCHQLRDSKPIGWANLLGNQLARRQVAQEAHLGRGSDPGPEQIRDLRDNEYRDQDRTWMVLKEAPAAAVLDIVGVVCRVERSRVGDQWAVDSDLRISSIRCETSLRPLRPAAPRRRFPPSTR